MTALRMHAARRSFADLRRWLFAAALLSGAPAAAMHAQSAAETPAAQPPRRFVWEDHPTFRFGGQVQVQLRARAAARARGARVADARRGPRNHAQRAAPGVPALRGPTALDATYFSPEEPVAGVRDRLGVELAWQPGPFSVKSEYIRLSDERPDTAASRAPLVASGWYASATYVLTHERKIAGLSTPARPVHRGGLGTIEIAARVDALRFRDGDRPHSAVRAATAGVNWQLNRWVRAQFNLIRERLENPSTAPQTRPRHWHRVFRMQIVI